MKLRIRAFIVVWLAMVASGSLPVLAKALPGDTVDVVKYNLNLDVLNLPARVIAGKAGVEFTVKAPVSVVPLELKLLQVDSVKDATGQMLAFTRSGDRLDIQLQSPMGTADTALVWIWYHGVPFSESWGGFHFSGSYAFNLGVGFQSIPHNLGKAWFPCVDDFTDRALYDYHIRVENTKTAVCGGLLQSVTDNQDGTLTYFWHSTRTLPTYLASVAVGPYALKSDVFNGMEADIPITYYVRPSDTNKVAGTFVNMKNIASIYESRFGPYPFGRIGVTGTSLGAMEHAENIFYPHGSITGNTSSEWLYAHELSHMWFGDKVTCASDADMWLNEGWARWCEILFTEDLYGIQDADAYYRSLLKDVLQKTHFTDDGYRALSPMDPEYTYGSTVYDKGALVAHALRYYMGDDLFFEGVRDYLATYAFNHADSYQLRDALSQSGGMDLTGFFDFYVFTPGFTHYSVDSFRVAPKCGQYQVELFMKQKHTGTEVFMNDCRVELSFMRPDRTFETLQVNFSGEHDTALVTLAFEPVLVLTDLYNHASDATTDQARTLKSTGLTDFEYTFCKLDVKQLADSAFVMVTHNWVAPDSLKVPHPGLTLSTRHYWTIEGVFPEGFKATGVFSYNRNILDGDILTASGDSLVMLYRPDAGHDWQGVGFSRIGPWQIGTMYVENLQPGQYALAVWDEEYVGYNVLPGSEKILNVFPNPSGSDLNILTSLKTPSSMVIHTTDGRKVFQKSLSAGENIRWKGTPGTYLISLYHKNHIVATTKAIIN